MQEIMFSVAIITYNQEEYISQTLDSILNQKHNYKYEIVVGEDCSTDNTKKIIEEYVAKYPQIIKPIYNNPNKGIIKNYFNVINNCQGKYIMECAGDDYWLQNKVNTQISFMEENKNVGMCYGKALFYENDNKKFQKKKFGTKWVKFNQLIQDNKIPALSVCIKNEIIKKYIKDINPEEKKWLMEDYPLWIWISKNSKIHFINKTFGVYRIGQDSASLAQNIEKQLAFSKNYHEIKTFFSNLYSIQLPEWNEFENLFFLCYDALRKNYSKEYQKKLCINYKKILNKNIKMKIIYYVSFSKYTFKIFMLLRNFI